MLQFFDLRKTHPYSSHHAVGPVRGLWGEWRAGKNVRADGLFLAVNVLSRARFAPRNNPPKGLYSSSAPNAL
jgi:hypothetical protein